LHITTIYNITQSLRRFFHQWIFGCTGRVASWHFTMPNGPNLQFEKNGCEKSLFSRLAIFWYYSSNLALNFLVWQELSILASA